MNKGNKSAEEALNALAAETKNNHETLNLYANSSHDNDKAYQVLVRGLGTMDE